VVSTLVSGNLSGAIGQACSSGDEGRCVATMQPFAQILVSEISRVAFRRKPQRWRPSFPLQR